MARSRWIRLSVVVALFVVGVAAASFVYFRAGQEPPDGDAPTEEGSATEQASGDSGQGAEDPGSDAQDADEGEEGETAIPVAVASAGVGPISTYISATANLVPEDEVKVLAETEGRVSGLRVEEGDRIRGGQLLAAVNRDEAEILFNKAKLKATNAGLAFERTKRMFEDSLVSQEEYDKVTMDDQIARQELAEAKWSLDRTEIRAPFGGRVTQRFITLGQHVRPGDELFVVTDFEPLIARIYLPERDVLLLDVGREVGITLGADESVRFKGRIRQISPVVDVSTGTVKVTVEAIDPPGIVRPGGFVTIDIVRETHDDAVLLPRKAIVRELKKAHVFVANGDVAEKRPIELGIEEGDRMEVLAGVEPGEQVVVEGQGSLKDGAAIKIIQDVAESRPGTAPPARSGS